MTNEKDMIKKWIQDKRSEIYDRLRGKNIEKKEIDDLMHTWRTRDADAYRFVMLKWGLRQVDMLILSDLEDCHKWIFYESDLAYEK